MSEPDQDKELIEKATEVIRRHDGKPDAVLLMRELKIGYPQAARLLDALEEQGVVEARPPLPPSRRRNDGVPTYLLEEAVVGIAYTRGSVSPGSLQRDFEISYPVAARLLDSLEASNILQRKSDEPRWTLNDAWRHE
jgi:DNA segregation ATPase FtsK/SpoIIIE-like protein